MKTSQHLKEIPFPERWKEYISSITVKIPEKWVELAKPFAVADTTLWIDLSRYLSGIYEGSIHCKSVPLIGEPIIVVYFWNDGIPELMDNEETGKMITLTELQLSHLRDHAREYFIPAVKAFYRQWMAKQEKIFSEMKEREYA